MENGNDERKQLVSWSVEGLKIYRLSQKLYTVYHTTIQSVPEIIQVFKEIIHDIPQNYTGYITNVSQEEYREYYKIR